ncbi:WD40/YVTN/BNR-like repeat-containing protein [Aquibacillus saliphilus]|uniref:WD40/YVTN/BNR-like repeat-containing protein n=1 Tax=Aquibacillus saliphilus TaxID=1909422 RepID=UPI001CEFB94A|nr:sialidase family protein [Aquibacillus saliphilus]
MGKSPNKKQVIIIGAAITFLLAWVIIYYFQFYQDNLNENLPVTMEIKDPDIDMEQIAYRLINDYLQSFQASDTNSWNRITEVGFNEFQLLAGNKQEFAMAVTFQTKLERGKWSTHHSWGEVQDDGMVEEIQWTLRIKKIDQQTYSLDRIEPINGTIAGLEPVEDTYQKQAGIDVKDEAIRYEIVDNTLRITYKNGKDWSEVPVVVEDLFNGDYSGQKNNLIDNSFVITPQKTAFVYQTNLDQQDNSEAYPELRVLLSSNQGKTWDEVVVTEQRSPVRMRMIGFTSEQNGYLIITSDRTMSSEANTIFTTNDGGMTWRNVGSVEDTYRLVLDGGFITDKLGFISFSPISENGAPKEPTLYRTVDGGFNWEEVNVPIPTEYKGIFTEAEAPSFDGTQGTLLVNQGPNGDYQGGNVLARYISIDEGETWNFANLVDPENVLD